MCNILEKQPLCVLVLFQILCDYDKITAEHSRRVAEQGFLLGKQLDLSEDDLKSLITACLLHDIGKLKIPKEILNKTTKLNDDEWNIIKRHPEYGYKIINQYKEIEHVAYIILCHHEKLDGTGYEKHLVGKEIPFLSRVITVLDAFDAMTNIRSYKDAKSVQFAIEQLESGMNTQFDKEIVLKYKNIICN